MEDDVPRSLEGAVLAIADKADTIAGMFALGMIPSGSKDPFALRRAANGIVRILVEHNIPISLRQLMPMPCSNTRAAQPSPTFASVAQYEPNVAAFFRERLEFYLRDARGFAYDVTNAVLASGSDNAVDALARAEAVAKVRGTEDFDAISASFKRIKNILRQDRREKSTPGGRIATRSCSAPDAPVAERASPLHKRSGRGRSSPLQSLHARRQYDAALSRAASLRPLLDRFFDDVMVMVEDAEPFEATRLALLKMLYDDFSKIADFSEIVTGGKSS